MYKRQVLDALGKTGAPAAAPAQEARLPAASRQDFFQTMDAKTFRQGGAKMFEAIVNMYI